MSGPGAFLLILNHGHSPSGHVDPMLGLLVGLACLGMLVWIVTHMSTPPK